MPECTGVRNGKFHLDGYSYNSLKAMKAMNMLKELEEWFPVNR